MTSRKPILPPASSPSVIVAYEKRIEELERTKIRLAEQAATAVPSKGHPSEFIEPALMFLTNPWNIYKNGSFALKRTVLKLAFAEPLRYSRNEGYRTAEITFPFRVLADFSSLKCGMVEHVVLFFIISEPCWQQTVVWLPCAIQKSQILAGKSFHV